MSSYYEKNVYNDLINCIKVRAIMGEKNIFFEI